MEITKAQLLIAKNEQLELDERYLTFLIDVQLFGIEICNVVQIVGIQSITPVPEFPYYAKGIINLRGDIIPVIDMRLKFGKPEADYSERTCIIVTKIKEHHIGLIVDEVDEVAKIPDNLIAMPPKITDSNGSYLTGIGKLTNKTVLLINIQKMLADADMSVMTKNI